VTSSFKIVKCEKQYWEFVRLLRIDLRVLDGFVNKSEISKNQQEAYMEQFSDYYRIALLEDKPVGFFGVIENDIRICVHPDYQNQGIGKLLVKSCSLIWPNAVAKIKVSNEASIKLFESCGYQLEFLLYRKHIKCE
jgi:ribosomal protein S18 acetylase RimI-like enzyme